MEVQHLSELLDNAALARPDHAAVEDEHGRRFTYAELWRAADRLATRMARWGIERGDRVGLWLPKSLEAVAAIHGILRAGASYVPVDPTGPAARAAAIMRRERSQGRRRFRPTGAVAARGVDQQAGVSPVDTRRRKGSGPLLDRRKIPSRQSGAAVDRLPSRRRNR